MCRLFLVAFSLLLMGLPGKSLAGEKSAAQLLPESVVLYAETAATAELLGSVLDHPLRKKFEAFPKVQEWLAGEERKQLMMGVRIVEAQLGMPWREALEKLGAGGITVALDGASQSVAVLVKADDAAFLQKSHDTLINLARADALGKGKPDPFKSVSYRDISALRADELRIAVAGDWLILVTSAELGKDILDHLLDGPEDSLARNSRFQSARAARADESLAWAYADLDTIRSAGVAKELLGGKAQDPGAELVLGGVLNTLHHAAYASAQLTAAPEAIELVMQTPLDAAWTPREREFFFGPRLTGAAPPELGLPTTIAELRAYRGVSEMWLHGPDLFSEEINAGLSKANSDLSTLFGGRPFAEEVLGALDGGLRFVVAYDAENARQAAPSVVRLPGFAAVGRLKAPAQSQRPMRIAFQTAVGFANLDGALKGRPPLELATHRGDGKTLLTATYSPDDFQQGGETTMMDGASGVLLNFSPTIGFVDDYVVLSSTRTLADQLLERLAEIPASGPASSLVTNSALRVRADTLRTTVADNREPLIANNMLEKGHNRAEATREIEGLLTLLEMFQEGDASLLVSGDQLQLSLRLTSAQE